MNYQTLKVIVGALFVVSCGGGNDPPDPTVLVWKSLESRQCEGGGKSLQSIEELARSAGVQVRAGSCGSDGLSHVAVCGGSDGRIAILDIPQSQSALAFSAGFPSVSGLPFVRTAC